MRYFFCIPSVPSHKQQNYGISPFSPWAQRDLQKEDEKGLIYLCPVFVILLVFLNILWQREHRAGISMRQIVWMVQAMKRCIGLKRRNRTTNAQTRWHHGEQKSVRMKVVSPLKEEKDEVKKRWGKCTFLLWYFWMGFWKKNKKPGVES